MNLEFEIEEVAEDAPQEVKDSFAALDQQVLKDLVAYAFDHLYLSPETELSIAVVGEEEMEDIHLQWMDLPGPTDVMSFPMDELQPGSPDQLTEGVLGDIVLCPPVAARQGQEAGHSTLDELCLLTTHGILHCLGYDHATAAEETEMFGIQRQILEGFLGRPAPVETRH
ncbi:MAG: rRNA maturation RNase YbeY [Rothia sp. (in: high G+C Gram-positive bacteria)]|nr:rRNA maturation RNase YbeY [Rothia sp. (in: high G+C Gram-positive bacteria)]